MTSTLHADQIVFDGLIVANWGPDIFHDMRRGGLTAANCTCCIWGRIHRYHAQRRALERLVS